MASAIASAQSGRGRGCLLAGNVRRVRTGRGCRTRVRFRVKTMNETEPESFFFIQFLRKCGCEGTEGVVSRGHAITLLGCATLARLVRWSLQAIKLLVTDYFFRVTL